MTDSWASPGDFVRELTAMDESASPWPGPRPLAEGEIELLVGRESDLRRFVEGITFYRLTHLTGVSGVGKTSLLMAGIVPELRRRGYVVATCRDWSNFGGREFDEVLAERLYDTIPESERANLTRGTDLFWDLHDMGGTGVIILDQFEEIVRQSRSVRDEVLEFLAQLYAETSIPVVLSYRSEYVHAFRRLDQDLRVGGRSFALEVEPVEPHAARHLIEGPRRPRAASEGWTWTNVIEPEAAEAVYVAWASTQEAHTSGLIPVGMLHLQALLYVLSHRATGAITEADVKRFTSDAESRGATRPADWMAFALEESAQTRLELAEAAAERIGMDVVLRNGVGASLAETLPLLSSGGFKLERDVADLADSILGSDVTKTVTWLGDMGVDGTRLAAAAIDVMTAGVVGSGPSTESLLAASRAEICRAVDRRLDEPVGEAIWGDLLSATPSDPPTSGPILGLNQLVALLESLRRFGWALVWLNHLNLARVNAGGERTSVTLVHDGLGEPLRRWSRRYEAAHPARVIFELMAPEGQEHLWSGPQAAASLSGTEDRPRVHVNLAIRGNSIIAAELTHVVFSNCDFRGVLFLRCRFTGVTFVNCRLDGALFSDCTLEGGGADVQDPRPASESVTYLLPDPTHELRDLLEHYREEPGGSEHQLFADRPGRPTISARVDPDVPRLRPVSGGMLIQGSRVSALTFRGTAFRDGAVLTFDHVRGSGIDIAELAWSPAEGERPQVTVQSSLLRHVAFTGRQEPRGVVCRVYDSDVAQWWIGAGLRGSLGVERSRIGQLWVEASENGFVTTVDETNHVRDVRGAGAGVQARDLAGSVDDLAAFREASARMDYRRD